MTFNEDWSSGFLGARCSADGEFGVAARFWTGGLRLEIGEPVLGLTVADGAAAAGEPAP
jgi:hypothetical protein